jgi:hypothetical protein
LADPNWINHTVWDSGGILRSGWRAWKESQRYRRDDLNRRCTHTRYGIYCTPN